MCDEIGELSARAGVHLETIRYYERIGLLPPPGRTSNGHRRYG
ncbi:MerR family DNA-binding transcriptional regulator [Brevundimonas denitrificans]|nr:MerR family DNA-binding transcriptional regulator [Brevundimonas denitrificans]